MAEGASDHASGREETSSSTEEVASRTMQNADSAHQANTLMAETVKKVDEVKRSTKEFSTASEGTAKIVKTIFYVFVAFEDERMKR